MGYVKTTLITLGILFAPLLISNNSTEDNENHFQTEYKTKIIENTKTLEFKHENGDIIDGEVLIDNISIGFTNNGNISTVLNEMPSEILFKGNYNGQYFEAYYYDLSEYFDYNYMPFSVSESYIEDYTALYSDKFSKYNGWHYPHMPLIYRIDNSCKSRSSRIENLNKAFQEFNKSTNGSVYFREGEEGEHIDISFYCYSQESIGQIINNGEKETLGLGGIESGYGNVIFNSSVIFFGNPVCGYFPVVEVHEILHAFGYEHRENVNVCSLMNALLDCNSVYENEDICGKPKIDNNIAQELIDIYGNK